MAHLPDSTDCLIVDPGFEPEKIIDYLERRGLIPAAILITHAHSDHIAGNEAIKNRWPECQLAIGAAEAPKLIDPRLNLSAMFGLNLVSPPADVTLEDGEFYTAAGIGLQVRAIPGHSSGHVVYLIEDCDPMMVFVGDVIFAGSIGRTDFPDGDFNQLAEASARYYTRCPIPPFSCPATARQQPWAEEKRGNPFVRV